MKKLISIILILSLALSLAACGGTTDTASTAETKVFTTAKGDIEIPVAPQKIVTDYYLGEFLALGVKPVLASPYALNNPFLADYIDGIQSLDVSTSETMLEMITAAEPDLIVTLSEADYDKFSQIAPTVLIPYGAYTPDQLFLYIGDMLGKKEDAQSFIDNFKANAASVKSEMQGIVGDKTVSLVEIWPKEIYTMGNKFGRGGIILFDLWGLKAPAKVQTTMVEGETAFEVVSLEALAEYTGDFIFYGVLDGADSAFVESSDVWKNLPAVKDGKTMAYEQVAYMHSDPISLTAQLQAYTDYFREAK